MKQLLLIAWILSSQFSFSQNHSLNSYKSYFDNQFKKWTKSYHNFLLPGFHLSHSAGFENVPFDDIKNLKEFYKKYKLALSFSPDKNQFIDIYSYQLNLEWKGGKLIAETGVDGAVSLCNLKTRKWTRIHFCGASSGIEDVMWISNTRFILVGYEMDESNKFRPNIFIGNTLKQKFYVYKTDDENCFGKKDGYTSTKLKALKFVQE